MLSFCPLLISLVGVEEHCNVKFLPTSYLTGWGCGTLQWCHFRKVSGHVDLLIMVLFLAFGNDYLQLI
jgi:hypothetical protein